MSRARQWNGVSGSRSRLVLLLMSASLKLDFVKLLGHKANNIASLANLVMSASLILPIHREDSFFGKVSSASVNGLSYHG